MSLSKTTSIGFLKIALAAVAMSAIVTHQAQGADMNAMTRAGAWAVIQEKMALIEAGDRDFARFQAVEHTWLPENRARWRADFLREMAQNHEILAIQLKAYANAGGKLSALGAVGLAAAALVGHQDVQASTVRSVSMNETGAPKPLTLEGSNVGASRDSGAGLRALMGEAKSPQTAVRK